MRETSTADGYLMAQVLTGVTFTAVPSDILASAVSRSFTEVNQPTVLTVHFELSNSLPTDEDAIIKIFVPSD